MFERRGEEERLERRAGLPPAAARAVELRLREVAAADERQHVAGARIDRDERRLQIGLVEPPQPAATACSATSCSSGTNVVRTSQSGGWSPPNRSRNCWRRNSFA